MVLVSFHMSTFLHHVFCGMLNILGVTNSLVEASGVEISLDTGQGDGLGGVTVSESSQRDVILML